MKPINCYLAMFDIIGFKTLRNQLGTTGLYKKYKQSIQPMIEHSAAGRSKVVTYKGEERLVPDFSVFSVKYKIISDSIILYTEDDLFSSFIKIINSSHMLLQSGFNGGQAPYRGAISHGDLIDDPDGTYIGSAIEDAYIGESSQVWSGCILTKTCSEFAESKDHINDYKGLLKAHASEVLDSAEKNSFLMNSNRITKYRVPMQNNPKDGAIKYSNEERYVLDWTTEMYSGASGKSFNDSDSNHSNLIKTNTIDFENWARENNRI